CPGWGVEGPLFFDKKAGDPTAAQREQAPSPQANLDMACNKNRPTKAVFLLPALSQKTAGNKKPQPVTRLGFCVSTTSA
ncbi:hypothetical protein, partial [Pseudomonas sp. PA-5-4B]|uniref:hypothetical protein n=1 Tax=Pseudomonas sp. PA-5-4B TaxID=2665478 RepID=UPI001F26F266